jgi:hypothetical protein
LLDDDAPVAESSSDQNRFVVETDLVVNRNAIVHGSLTVRARRFWHGAREAASCNAPAPNCRGAAARRRLRTPASLS